MYIFIPLILVVIFALLICIVMIQLQLNQLILIVFLFPLFLMDLQAQFTLLVIPSKAHICFTDFSVDIDDDSLKSSFFALSFCLFPGVKSSSLLCAPTSLSLIEKLILQGNTPDSNLKKALPTLTEAKILNENISQEGGNNNGNTTNDLKKN